mmetsp:Transcript_29971/g.49471  ORF Transcript_29971/g.49471 Transcript_29971/m.49471 type:complete len:245 (-) Transcript_29971:577-1311(-)
MNPYIGTILLTLLHWQRLMQCTIILTVGVVIQNGWPNYHLALFGRHRQAQIGKLRLTTSLHVVQIRKDSQNAHSCLYRQVSWIVIVVFPIKLAHLILQQLQKFGILMGNARQFSNTSIDALGDLIFLDALVFAPCVLRGATATGLVGNELDGLHVAFFGANGNQGIAFVFRQELIKGDYPRTILDGTTSTAIICSWIGHADNGWFVLLQGFISGDALKELIQRTGIWQCHGDAGIKRAACGMVQ